MRSPEVLDPADRLRERPLVLATLWLAGVGVADAYSGPDLALEPGYLAGLLALTWLCGSRVALWATVPAALIAAAIDWRTSTEIDALTFVWNGLVRLGLFVVPVYLLGELKLAQRRLRQTQVVDRASGLAHRGTFLAAVADDLARTERYGGESSLVSLGVDGLKELESQQSHARMEEWIGALALQLQRHTRRTDLVGRMGDDEFAILLRETGSVAAPEVAEKHALALGRWARENDLPLTFTVGWTSTPRGRELSAEALVAHAVAHMYGRRPRPSASMPRPQPVREVEPAPGATPATS